MVTFIYKGKTAWPVGFTEILHSLDFEGAAPRQPATAYGGRDSGQQRVLTSGY